MTAGDWNPHTADVKMALARTRESDLLKTCPGNTPKIGNEEGVWGAVWEAGGEERDSEKQRMEQNQLLA